MVAITPSTFAPLSYEETNFPDKLAPPLSYATTPKLEGFRYLMGADRLGRDVFSRLIYGTRVSMAVAFIGAGISFIIGLTYGLTAGYSHGKVDNAMMRIVDIIYAFPTLILIILLQVFLTALAQQPTEDLGPLQSLLVTLDCIPAGSFLSSWRSVR